MEKMISKVLAYLTSILFVVSMLAMCVTPLSLLLVAFELCFLFSGFAAMICVGWYWNECDKAFIKSLKK